MSLLSERRIAVPELAGGEGAQVHAAPGFTLIATANLRDKGVSEMSAALKRRFNFETVGPIGDLDAETALVRRQSRAAVERVGAAYQVDEAVLEALVTAFRDLREGRSAEGWEVERPSTVMSTAEAVSVAGSLGLAAAYFPGDRDVLSSCPAICSASSERTTPPTRHGCWGTGTGRCAGAPSRGRPPGVPCGTCARCWRTDG